MAKITPDEVRRIAALANIGLEEADVARMTGELEEMLQLVGRLQEVDTAGVKPTDQVTGLEDIMRPDEVKREFSREELMAGAPDQQDGFFKVKRVLNND